MNREATTDYLLDEVLRLDAASIDDFVLRLADAAVLPFEVKPRLVNEEDAALACSIFETRRLRTRFINASMLGEPVWDMLLALYCFTARREAVSVSGLCSAADVPATTALRWIRFLEQKELIKRRHDMRDGRRKYLSLTTQGEGIMTDYLIAARERMAATQKA